MRIVTGLPNKHLWIILKAANGWQPSQRWQPWIKRGICDDLPVMLRQTKIPSGVAVGEAFVIEAQAVENGRLKVVDVDRLFHDVVAQFVGRPEGHARLDATPLSHMV